MWRWSNQWAVDSWLTRNRVSGGSASLDGPGGSVILTERNKAALKVLDDTIKTAANGRFALTAAPAKNQYLKTVVPWLKRQVKG